MSLRKHQIETINKIKEQVKIGVKYTLLVLPLNFGKTIKDKKL